MREHLVIRQTDALRAVEQTGARSFQKTGKMVVFVQKDDEVVTKRARQSFADAKVDLARSEEVDRSAQTAKGAGNVFCAVVAAAPIRVDEFYKYKKSKLFALNN